jgi:hypothetical protein
MGGCCAAAAAASNRQGVLQLISNRNEGLLCNRCCCFKSIGCTAIEFKSKWGVAALPLLLLQIDRVYCN